jgi:uncharacterized secreted protein with C-terminal beta-propeller domain
MRRTCGVALSLVVALGLADAATAAPKPRLKAFASCKSLVSYARAGAERTDGGTGVVPRAAPVAIDQVVTPPLMPTPTDTSTTAGGIVPPAAAPVSGRAETAPEFSGTNTQELDVDEPDIVKTDGQRIFAVTDRTLRVVDVASGTVTGTLKLDGYGHSLLLRGNRVLAISTKGGAPFYPTDIARPVAPTIAPVASATIVTEIDVTGAPKVLRTMEVPGRFVDARQNGGTARLVIDAEQEPFIATPDEPVDEQIDDAGLVDFLPHTVLKSNLSGKTFTRKLAPCAAVAHPSQFSGLGVLAILTVDLDRGMYSLDRDGVMAGAQVVYGSSGSLYVASRRYVRALELGQDVPEGTRTEIHRFDVSDPSKTVYKATGTVPGFVLNNYALSEYEGKLRVATTEDPSWATGESAKSTVTVLDQQANQLVRVGSVSGLGQGERIYAVRFIGPMGYVVTFRQVDPLYTVDLSDPTAPKVVGELKIPGYSAYLHPVGENKLLGIGREGQAVQASLFDVSDPAAPQRLAALSLGNGATPVETEPHAFLYWAKSNLAVMPLQTYDGNSSFTGAAGIRIGPNTLADAGRVQHTSAERSWVPIDRTFVIGDRLYTLSYLGLEANRLDNLGPLGFTAF